MEKPDPPPDSIRLYAYLAISALLSLANWILLLIPNYLEERSWSSQKIGWVIGIFFLVNLVFQILAGRFADRHGNVPTALMGAGLSLGGGLFYVAALWQTDLLFVARVLHAAGAGMIFAGALMQLVRSVPMHLRGRMMGYYGLPGFVMMGLGPILAEWFAYRWGFSVIFAFVPLISVLIAWILTLLPRPLAPRGTGRRPFISALGESLPGLKSILVLSILFGLCFSAWNSFIAPAVRSVGAGAVSSFGVGYAIGAVITRLGISPRLETGSRRLWAVATLGAYGVSLGLIPHTVHPWQLVVLGLVCGMVHGIYYPSLSSIAAERFHPLHSAQSMSLYISASALGMFLGPPLWGTIVDRTGYGIMFGTAGLLMVVSAAAFVHSQYRSDERLRHSATSDWQSPSEESL